MIITICIGSSCHLKGSREIVFKLEDLIKLHNISDKIELVGSFCIGNCKSGVCVKVDNDLFSLLPDETEGFFTDEILRRLSNDCNQL
jgi:NADH:ubiquinone oxidoreductase subunit E